VPAPVRQGYDRQASLSRRLSIRRFFSSPVDYVIENTGCPVLTDLGVDAESGQ
jgi:hypothetical protein